MKTISKIAVLTMAVFAGIAAYGQKIEKNVLWDAALKYSQYNPYIPNIWSTTKSLKFYETPPENLWLDFGLARYDERTYEFHEIRNAFGERSDTLDYTLYGKVYRKLTCKVVKGDTLVVKVNNESIVKCKLSEYIAKAPIKAKIAKLKQAQERYLANRRAYLMEVEECERYNAKVQAEYERDSIIAANSLALLEHKIQAQRERQKNKELEAQMAEARKRIYGNLEADISDPAKPLQTKTLTNLKGAKVTYQYYINDNGYEVKHGKFTETMTFKNHKYWTGFSEYGWVFLDGSESCTYYYKNGILHGRVTYSSNISASSTFRNDELLHDSISFDVYKGVITGNFKFSYNGITYTGKATNGILDYCNYETNDGYHGKLTSNSAGDEISISVIDNGYRTFELDAISDFPAVCCRIPTFYFPRTGK